jgi:hypothetical protein
MPDLTQALLVPFVAGFIVQRFLEIVDPFTTAKISDANRKKSVLGGISLALGWLLAGFGHIEIFSALCTKTDPCFNMGHIGNIVFSGIFISAGTEGFNSLMKFANYKKESSKADAAQKKSGLTTQQLNLVNPQT